MTLSFLGTDDNEDLMSLTLQKQPALLGPPQDLKAKGKLMPLKV